MRIAIVGSGGVGGYFGGKLAAAHEVAFIARGEHLGALRRDGLRVESIAGDFHRPSVQASDRPEDIGPVDAVFVAVKTWQLGELAPQLSPLCGADTAVVPLLNGVEAPDLLAAALGPEKVLGGYCQIISFVAGPGLIRHVGVEPTVYLGELRGGSSERVDRLVAAFEQVGVQAIAETDVVAGMWTKLMFISSWGGVAALARAPIGTLRTVSETRALLRAAIDEVYATAIARGVDLPSDAGDRAMAFIDSMPEDGTASLQRDVEAGRPTELDAWSGAVARLGAEKGVPTPVHATIAAALQPLERRARGEVLPGW